MTRTDKTIAIDIRPLGKKRTGDEMVFFHLTKEILKLDKKNQYLLLTDETETEKIKKLSTQLACAGQENIKIIFLTSKNRFTWNLWTLPKYLFFNKVDIFHTQYILPLFWPRRTKIITHIHDVSFRAYPKLINKTDRLFLSLLIPRSLRKASFIITPSQFTKNEIIKYYGINAGKITVIPNAIGEEFLEDTIKNLTSEQSLKKKYHLPEKFILYVGTLQPRKNIPFLIEVFTRLQARFRKDGPGILDAKLVLVGNQSGRRIDKRITEVISEKNLEDSVVFPGFIDQNDLPRVIRMADIFVFPSLYEGFGIPVLEAMSQNVPVAASDIPSLRETASDAVIYFDPANIANCEKKLYTLIIDQNQKETLTRRGNERMRLFSWEKSAKLLHNVYNNIL